MGAVFGLFAGFYYWTPKIVGKIFSEFLGKIHFWTLFIGVNFDYYFQIKKLMILKYYNLFKFIKNIGVLLSRVESGSLPNSEAALLIRISAFGYWLIGGAVAQPYGKAAVYFVRLMQYCSKGVRHSAYGTAA